MSLRALTREQSDFVVRFVNDGSVMVRQKVHIVTDSQVRLNEVYPVRWGENDNDTCDAIVLAAGDYIAMSAKADAARKDERFVLASTSDETVVPSNSPEDAQSYCSEPSQASPSPSPPIRRRVRPAPTTPKSLKSNTSQTQGYQVKDHQNPYKEWQASSQSCQSCNAV